MLISVVAYKDHILLYSDKIHIFGSCSRQLGTTAGMPMHVEIGLITLLVLQCHKKSAHPWKPPTFGSNSCITRISIYQSHKWLAISCWFEKRWKPHSSFNWPNAAAVLWRPLWHFSTYNVRSGKLWLKGGELWMLTDYVKVQAATMATTHGHSLVTLQYCHWASQTHNSTDGVGYLN